jgi:pantothenate kinase
MLRSVERVADVVSAAMSTDYRIVVGIAGSPGAGKSTVAERLVEQLGARSALISMDGFHLSQARLVELARRDRMGAPDTFDVPGLLATLVAIRRGFGAAGRRISAPGFDRTREEPVPDAVEISADVSCVVIEGNYLLLESGGWERVSPLLDQSFFIELDRETRRGRLVARHERYGKTPAEALAWALGPDEANALVIERTASRADYRIALG